MTTLPLSESASVTLDGSGSGSVRIGPNAPGVIWRPGVVGVRVSSMGLSPTCQIYAGPSASPSYFCDGTYTGQQNSTDAVKGQELRVGQYVWAVWSGGDPGAEATLTVTGTKDIPGPG